MVRTELQGLLMAIPILVSANSAAGQESLTLTVLVEGGEAGTGQAIASLFSSDENYLNEPIFDKIMPIDEDGGARFLFDGLAEGTYSVSVIYDKNSDGELNTGLFGIPSELVGFSNNAKGIFGPPSFDKTSFPLPSSQTITIFLGKAKD